MAYTGGKRKGEAAMKCGIVDVGSNTIRLSIYHWEGSAFKRLMNQKEMAGLAGMLKECARRVADIHETEGWE